MKAEAPPTSSLSCPPSCQAPSRKQILSALVFLGLVPGSTASPCLGGDVRRKISGQEVAIQVVTRVMGLRVGDHG